MSNPIQIITGAEYLPYAGGLRMFYLFICYFIANDVKGRESSLNYFTFLFKFPNVAGILQQTDR